MPDTGTPGPNTDLTEAALQYHREPTPGKLSVVAKKPLANQRDLALAYSPGVAAACNVIVADPREVDTVTGRANLVAVSPTVPPCSASAPSAPWPRSP